MIQVRRLNAVHIHILINLSLLLQLLEELFSQLGFLEDPLDQWSIQAIGEFFANLVNQIYLDLQCLLVFL